jgi:choline dehydrogenase-like flavoprotein
MTTGPLPIPVGVHAYTVAGFMVTTTTGSRECDPVRDDMTFYAVGGMPFGSVCDDAGRVLGQRGLYVVDGSRIAGSCAATNPSITIAALAEYSMDRLLQEDRDVLA